VGLHVAQGEQVLEIKSAFFAGDPLWQAIGESIFNNKQLKTLSQTLPRSVNKQIAFYFYHKRADIANVTGRIEVRTGNWMSCANDSIILVQYNTIHTINSQAK
jgi:hypothetical protein